MDRTFGIPGLARERALRALGAGSLALVLIVVAAAAAIRHGGGELGGVLALVRGAHRFAASAATLLIVPLAWLAWRAGQRAAAAAIVGVTAALSILGAATGTGPPPAAQAANLLGGILLAALLARLLARGAPLRALLALAAAQVLLGAWIGVFAEELWSWPLALHAVLGVALAAAAAWLGLRRHASALVVLALATPAAGIAAALLNLPFAATLAHACAAALLVCAIAYSALDAHQGNGAGTGQARSHE